MTGARILRAFGFVLAALALLVTPGAAADVVLHEYVAPDAVEDLRLGATSSDGTMSAAIQTQSGPIASPDLERPAEPGGTVYGPGRTPPGGGSTFRVDRDTSRPDTVSYDDPFTPSIAPYKREFAYDAVDEHLDLVVHDAALARVPIGGTPRPEDDQFYADLKVDLVEGQAVRIPTVGAGARILALRTVPKISVQVFQDGAENWFIQGDREGRIRLILHLSIDRATFGSPFADAEWNKLWRIMPSLPERVKSEGIRVARQIGVVDGTGPSEALRILVRHFRSFAPSNDRPKSTGPDLYRELATSQKGVCRHRSYAFVVTALALGIPSRFVRNEAHAWVEVSDGVRWHRVDLGGAADHLDSPDANRLPHVPPRDPFEWPSGAESGLAMADRSRTAEAAPAPRGSATAPSNGPATTAASALPENEANADDRRPRSSITLSVGGNDSKRGARLSISGRAEAGGASCAAARVDLFLEPKAPARERLALGVLVTDGEGRYDGHIVVPYTVPPGDYEVRATTPGNAVCGDGESP